MRKVQTRVNLILELLYCPSHTRSTRVKKKGAVGVSNEKGRTSKEGFPSTTRAWVCVVHGIGWHEEAQRAFVLLGCVM